MLRSSILSKTIINSRYLVNHKKPAVQLPIHKPPKYVYKVKYHPTAPPTFDEEYTDHAHMNQFSQVAMSQFQLYRFKYSGQWWYIGTIFPKLLVLAFPLYLFYQINDAAEQKAKSGRPGFKSWHHIPDLPNPTKIVQPEY